MNEQGQINLAGATLAPYYHACAFFHSRDEEYELVQPFVHEGLAAGDKAIHITDPELRDDHLQRLGSGGIEASVWLNSGQLEVLTWDDAYLKGGRFSASAMLAQLDEAISASTATGFPSTRIVGHMEWALPDRPGVNELLEYEARVNDVLSTYKSPAVCVYDVNQFGAVTLIDVMRTHPMVLIGGTLKLNPFFVPPREFLEELAQRRESIV